MGSLNTPINRGNIVGLYARANQRRSKVAKETVSDRAGSLKERQKDVSLANDILDNGKRKPGKVFAAAGFRENERGIILDQALAQWIGWSEHHSHQRRRSRL